MLAEKWLHDASKHFSCFILYLNVIIRFLGSLLISKSFTSQETFFFSPYSSAVSHSSLQRTEFHFDLLFFISFMKNVD